MAEDKVKELNEWTKWMKHENSTERFIHMFQAENDQLRIEDSHNCRLIYVRDKLVAAVDFETSVRLKLHPNTSPALSLTRRGEGIFLFVYLKEWER